MAKWRKDTNTAHQKGVKIVHVYENIFNKIGYYKYQLIKCFTRN